MKISQRPPKGFTLIELLVVITIIGILASLAMPGLNAAMERVNQARVVNDAKQIFLALKMFAGDNDGIFPSKAPNGNTLNETTTNNSNGVFRNLIPRYLPNDKPFYVAKSAFCTVQPNEIAGATLADNVRAGVNHFAYVNNLNETNNGSFPLIADGFANDDNGTYTTAEGEKGGLWKGRSAIVVRVDGSARAEKCSITGTGVDAVSTVEGRVGAAGALANIFEYEAASNWLISTVELLNPEEAGGTGGGGGTGG